MHIASFINFANLHVITYLLSKFESELGSLNLTVESIKLTKERIEDSLKVSR